MTSIDNYLASLPEYEAMKAPFQEKIDELEDQKATLEAELAEVIAFVPMKRITVFFSFPAMAETKEGYECLYIGIAPHDSTQPWQIKQLMEILKKDFIAGLRHLPGIYEYNFGILVPLDKMPEEISRRLSILATHADELDGPLTYSFNPSEPN